MFIKNYKWVIPGILLLISTLAFAQETQISDQIRVSLTPVIPAGSDLLPGSSGQILLNRLRQLATSGGYSGTSFVPQFVLAANPVLLEKKVVGTAPAKIWTEIELTLNIGDQFTRIIFSTTSITLQGVGATDTESLMDAYKNFSITKSELKEFTKKGRSEIIAYYNTNCDLILKTVDIMVNTNQAEIALDILVNIPTVSTTCYDKASEKAKKVWEETASQRCDRLMQAAKTAWANAPDRGGADIASGYLAAIPPQAKCKAEADNLVNEIKTKMLEIEQWERKQYNNQIDLVKLYIKALRDIGVAYGEGQPDTQIQVKGWLW